jgi:hypothetical protein
MEEMTGVRSECADPFLPVFQNMGGQGLLPHQEAVIHQAQRLLDRIP